MLTVGFGDGGVVRPFTVRKIQRGDQVVYQNSQVVQPAVLSPQIRVAMLELLRAVVSEGTGTAARLPGEEVAGKTGTTQDSRDAWFIGFTPRIIVGVWVGNDNHSPMNGVTGGDLPARIWRDFLAKLPAKSRQGVAQSQSRAALEDQPADFSNAMLASKEPAIDSSDKLTGVPRVLDTATLLVGGRRVRLFGVDSSSGRAARDFSRYIAGRRVTCEPSSAKPELYRCAVEGHDLAASVLFNGAGRANPDATPELRGAEDEAREAGRGIWAKP